MKTYIVTFHYDDEKIYQAKVMEDVLDSYMAKITNKQFYWNDPKTYGAWIDMDKVRRVVVVEYVEKEGDKEPQPPKEAPKEGAKAK